jgi:hypothetical protein
MVEDAGYKLSGKKLSVKAADEGEQMVLAVIGLNFLPLNL